MEESDEEGGEESDEEVEEVNLEAFDVPLKEWIDQYRTRREIQRHFRLFWVRFDKKIRRFSGQVR